MAADETISPAVYLATTDPGHASAQAANSAGIDTIDEVQSGITGFTVKEVFTTVVLSNVGLPKLFGDIQTVGNRQNLGYLYPRRNA